MTPYTPQPEDIAWAQATAAAIRDGGSWVWPGNGGAIYRFDHQRKTLTLVGITRFEDFHAEMQDRTRAVFTSIGYQLLDDGTCDIILGTCPPPPIDLQEKS